MGRYKYLDTLILGFVVVLLVSNLVAQKVCRFGPLVFNGAQLLFPITYICGDVFTEVYGMPPRGARSGWAFLRGPS